MAVISALAGQALDTGLNLHYFVYGAAPEIIAQTSSSLILDLAENRYNFTGRGVRYNDEGEPIAGTITGLQWSTDAVLRFSIDGLNIPAATFYQALYEPFGDSYTLLFPGNDELRGTALDDYLIDIAGHNIFLGGAGSDRIGGGSGNDHIYGQSPNGGPDGDDLLRGGAGSDYIQGNAGNDTIFGDEGSDRIQGGQGHDRILAGVGNDSVNGNLGNDTIDGYAGNDTLRGGQGDDLIRGGRGLDILMGDMGNDTLIGGGEGDVLIGGAGADFFYLLSENIEIATGLDDGPMNIIQDFEDGVDKIVLGLYQIVMGRQQATVEDAFTYAFDYAKRNDQTGALTVGVGQDTYVFCATTVVDQYSLVFLMRDMDPAKLTLDDFGWAGNFPSSTDFI